MSDVTSAEKYLLDIGYGLRIGLKGGSTWQVWAKNGVFDLRETNEFFRTAVLLERPYVDAKSLLEQYAKAQNAESGFPLWRVVGAGLACRSDQWASLALVWVPLLSEEERQLLLDLLMQVQIAKWASQKTRQLAALQVKRLQAPSVRR
jgi:hypothetical protein